MRQGTEPSGLGGSLKARHLERLSQENSSEQDQSLQSLKTTEMLNQYTDRQDVMLTKHILRTRTFLFNNKSIMRPSVGSIIHNSKIIVTVLTLKPTKGYFRRTSHPSSCCSISLYWSGLCLHSFRWSLLNLFPIGFHPNTPMRQSSGFHKSWPGENSSRSNSTSLKSLPLT